jgi:hypothetical protein
VNKSPLETGRIKELSQAQKMDLIVLSTNPNFQTVYDLMENEVLAARDEAMAVDPTEDKKQVARMTEAHAMAKFYQKIRKQIEFAATEQLAKVQEKAAQEATQEQEFLEEIVLQQASGN